MKIYVTSIFVNNQREVLKLYIEVLEFEKKNDIPVGEYSWLTVTGKGDRNGTELLIEPSDHAAVGPFREALKADGISSTFFQVDNLDAEYKRLCDKGVVFTQTPTEASNVIMAIFDDTCGNLI